jgi:hypothetical protein
MRTLCVQNEYIFSNAYFTNASLPRTYVRSNFVAQPLSLQPNATERNRTKMPAPPITCRRRGDESHSKARDTAQSLSFGVRVRGRPVSWPFCSTARAERNRTQPNDFSLRVFGVFRGVMFFPESNKTERFHQSFHFGPRCTNDLRRHLYKSFDFGFWDFRKSVL